MPTLTSEQLGWQSEWCRKRVVQKAGGAESGWTTAAGAVGNGVDLAYFVVVELARSFGFPCKNGGAESLRDFRYALTPRHLRQWGWQAIQESPG